MATIGPELLGRLFDEHAAALVLYARQWSDAPEDVVQEAFVQLARQRIVPDRVVPWLFRVVRNGAIGAAGGTVAVAVARRGPRPARRGSPRTDDRIDADHAARLLAELDAGDPRGRSWPGSGAA